jgi:hypothetical protein
MKKFRKFIGKSLNPFLLIACGLTLNFASCKKIENDLGDFTISASKVAQWLDSNKKLGQPIKNSILDSLKKNVIINSLSIEKLSSGEQLLIIPLNKNFVSNNNRDKNPINVLLLFENKNGKIVGGNIVQFVLENMSEYTDIPQNTLQHLFNNENLGIEGIITFLSVSDIYSHQYEFSNGKLSKYIVASGKPAKSVASSPSNLDELYCTQWWLVTTTFFEDGHTEVEIEDLGISCSTCPPNQLCDHLDGEGGGTTTQTIYQLSSNVEWIMDNAANNSWRVVSYEKLKGEADPSSPQHNYFTSITHSTSTNFNAIPKINGVPYTSWRELGVNNYLASNNYAAWADVSGKLTFYDGTDISISKTKAWLSTTVFPH